MQKEITDLYKLKPSSIWEAFTAENFAFWMACLYLFFEYIRPQSIWPFFADYPYWARTFIILAFIGWILDRNKMIIWNKITTAVFVFLFLVTLSSLFAYQPDISWENFMIVFSWVVIFFVLTQIITTRRRFYIILLIFLVASFKLSFYGARTFAMRGFAFADWGLAGPEGFFQNPGELAIQMVVFAPIAYFFILGIRKYLTRWKAYILYLMPITAIITIIGTNTRGSQIAIAAVLLSLVAIQKKRVKMFIAVTFIGIIGYNLLPPQQIERFSSMGSDGTSQQRLLYIENGIKMMKEYPMLGVGYFNFVPYYEDHYIDDIVISHHAREGRVELPHNILIQIGTDAGLLGLLIFVSLVCGAFYITYKIGKEARISGELFTQNMAIGLNLALIGYLVAGQFVTVAYYPFFWIHLVLVISMHTYWQYEKSQNSDEYIEKTNDNVDT